VINGFDDLIYAEGFGARCEGQPLNDVPQSYASLDRKVWQAGWQDADIEATHNHSDCVELLKDQVQQFALVNVKTIFEPCGKVTAPRHYAT
jgi:hypothetical protein